MNDPARACTQCQQLKRRDLLRAGAVGATTVVLGQLFPGRVAADDEQRLAEVAHYPRTKVLQMSALQADVPVLFNYPSKKDLTEAILVKLGRPAGSGVGDDHDIVAFSANCTHMGGSLSEGYLSQHKVLGCSEHLTTFDLTRHGMVVAGHATQSLPQILLTLEGDDLYATGIIGLLYGYHDNRQAVEST